MRSSLVLFVLICNLTAWASPFEMQLMAVPVRGNENYKFVFPKFSNESESAALDHYFANLKTSNGLQSIVKPDFRRILGNGITLTRSLYRSRVLMVANADYHHTSDSDDLIKVADTLAEIEKQAFALPVSAMSGLDLHDRIRFLALLRKHFGGIVPLGGDDIHYSRYGKVASSVDGPMNLQRDIDEADVLKAFIFVKRFPHTTAVDSRAVIAFCRGCQELGVVLGYELTRDIPTQVVRPLNHKKNHLVKLLPTPLNLHRLGVDVITKGPYSQRGSVEVISRHHQAIKYGSQYPGKGLLLAATSSDGVAEAFETDPSHDLGPGVGTQHHPEYDSREKRLKFFSQVFSSCSFTFGIASPTL